MPPNRPPHRRRRSQASSPSSSASSFSEPTPSKRPKAWLEPPQNKTKVYIIQAKLEPEQSSELFALVDAHTGLLLEQSATAEESDVIITAIRMRRRLERHIPWELAVRVIIHPESVSAFSTPDTFFPAIDSNPKQSSLLIGCTTLRVRAGYYHTAHMPY